jgi:serine/threonine-protein kinase
MERYLLFKKTVPVKLTIILTFLSFIFPSLNLLAQTTRKPLPMTISFSEGYYDLTVPDTQTTKSAYGGKLRIYDMHIAKMFEVTYRDCQEFGDGGSREWSYFAGNGNINMGTFYLSCNLVNDIVSVYGLGSPQPTSIIVGQEESGRPRVKKVSIPTLNLTGEKEQKWITFTKSFKPISK